MRVLSGTPSITNEIKENTDPAISALLARHLEYGAEFNPADPADLLTVFVIEPGDTLHTIDAAMNGCFLTNHYSRRRVGDPDTTRASRRWRSTQRCTRCCSSKATRGMPL